LVYVDDVNILGGRVHAVKENTESLVVASMDIGLEVNTNKPKYMVMPGDQNAGRSHNITINNFFFERLEQFKYLGTVLTNRNSIHEEIKSRLKSGNAGYKSVSSSFLSKNIKIKTHNIIRLPVVLYGCATSSLTLREERRLRVFENRVFRTVFGPKRDEVREEWRNLSKEKLGDP
jgi:hypothetical protein